MRRPRAALHPLAAAVALAAAAAAPAQRRPEIGYVLPAGCRRGTTVEVEVGGQALRGVRGARVSGPGVHVEMLGHIRPLTPREVNELREEARKLVAGSRRSGRPGGRRSRRSLQPQDPEAALRLAEIQTILATRAPRLRTEALAEIVRLRVHVDAGAPTGARELRLVTPTGVTRPLPFYVGELPEIREREPQGPSLLRMRRVLRPEAPPPDPAFENHCRPPVVVNGQIYPGDVDLFRFHARAGRRMDISVRARALVPFLADAVPGWFQPVISVRDAQGKEIASADDFRFDPDPVLSFVPAQDGDHVLEIRDALCRGREDFVYRITIGEGLARREPAGAVAVPTVHGALRAEEPDDTRSQARPISLPALVEGCLERPADRDMFRFRAGRGHRIVAEVLARAAGSPLDARLVLADAQGRVVATADDRDESVGLLTHHADPILDLRTPAAGDWFLAVEDVCRRGGPEFTYRLRVGPPRPDFDLFVTPSGVGVPPGGHAPLTVIARRHGSLRGPIDLRLRDAPEGFAIAGARIPAGADRVTITVSAPRTRQEPIVAVHIEGVARAGEHTLVRRAVPVDDWMQAFVYHHLVPARELLVRVGGGRPWPALRIATESPVSIPRGGEVRLRVLGAPAGFERRIRLSLLAPPPGISLRGPLPSEAGRSAFDLALRASGEVRADAAGNLIVAVQAAPAAGGRGSRQATRRRGSRARVLGVLPAIPFRVAEAEARHGN